MAKNTNHCLYLVLLSKFLYELYSTESLLNDYSYETDVSKKNDSQKICESFLGILWRMFVLGLN